MNKSKSIVVLGGGGFIGGHLARRLKNEGGFVRVCDIRPHQYFAAEEICDEFIQGDLRDQSVVDAVIHAGVQDVYQLAADMGGAGYIFTGLNDANVMYNSALINLHVAQACARNKVGRLFYASSACIYPDYNQSQPDHPNCEESSAYPASPDSEYGWEKLFSERLFLAFRRNHHVDVRIARFHNIFGPRGAWTGGKEKAPAAMLRKAAETPDQGEIEVWGAGTQTRSFLYVDECVEAILRLMDSSFAGPVNIGSTEKVSINQLAAMAIAISGKNLRVRNLHGDEFQQKYGFKCPLGVLGRNSDNRLYAERIGWEVSQPLEAGLRQTYPWIAEQVAAQPAR